MVEFQSFLGQKIPCFANCQAWVNDSCSEKHKFGDKTINEKRAGKKTAYEI